MHFIRGLHFSIMLLEKLLLQIELGQFIGIATVLRFIYHLYCKQIILHITT